MTALLNRRIESPVPEPDTQIGVKLKHARMLRGFRLKDVAERVGCSESLISKVENGRANPSLTMLHHIAGALGTNLAALFAQGDAAGGIVMRAGQRPVIETDQVRRGEGITLERLIPYADGYLLQGNIHVIQAGGRSEGTLQHDGEEVGYVIEGVLELTVNGKAVIVRAGDSFHFKSNLPHSYRNPSDRVTRVVWINTPPTF